MARKYDFAGWATKNNVRCADGRIIRKNAFADQDGAMVPLFWNHQHNDPEMVLGHAILMNKDDGVYAYASFNKSAKAQHTKEAISHGDLFSLSIYANQLKQNGPDVLHGVIRELSVVPGGANPEALIETTMLAHGDVWEEEAMLHVNTDEHIILHSGTIDNDNEEDEEDEDMTVADVLETLSDDQKKAVAILIDALQNGEEISHSADNEEEYDIEDVLDTLNDEQAEAVSILIDAIQNDDDDEELQHSDEDYEDEYDDDDSDYEDEEYDIEDVLDTLTEEQAEAVSAIIDSALNDDMSHSMDDQDAYDVLDTLDDDQALAVSAILEAVADEIDDENEYEDEDDDDDDESEYDDNDDYDESDEDEEEYEDMKHNVFDSNYEEYGPVLSHSDMETIFEDWKRYGSLKDTIKHHMEQGGVLAHSVYNHDDAGNPTTEQTYGIADINYLFPDAKTINDTPEFISRQMDWVKKVMNGTRHTPFSRVKSIFADITMEEARAKGYMKGNLKAEEVFALLRRITTPQTIYKKQKLDRDDILDITDFNVVSWLKAEMRLMLEEETARAILIGDGRSVAAPDKISEDHIRPIYKDQSLYTIRVQLDNTTDEDDAAKTFIRESIKARKRYKGSGNLVLFTTADVHTNMILLEDQMGRPLYDTEEKLRAKLRVSDIVDVEPMEGQAYDNKTLMGIFVDLRDYNIGADKGGAVNFFDDFDIDYNQEKYLIESRFSGALVKPYSAIVVEMANA